MPTKESPSPFKGQLEEFSRQFPGGEIPPSALRLIDQQMDYNADKQRPMAGVYIQETLRGDGYLRRLEDIDESWVVQYLKNVITGIKINRNNSLREEDRNVRERQTVADADGEFIELSSIQLERHKYSALDVQKWAEKLPYLLKRLHDKSKEGGISLLSLLISFERAKRKRVMKGGEVKPGEILAERVYFMDKTGHLTTRVTENKHKVHEIWMRWIRGFEDYKDSYFYDAMELLDICEKLGIDIGREDPFEYQEEYISTLAVTYIAKNRDVVMRGCRPVNRAMIEELKCVTFEDYKRTQNYLEGFDEGKLMRRKTQRFLSSHDTRIDANLSRMRDLETFVSALELINKGDRYRISTMPTADGFYMRDRVNPRKFDVSCIFREDDRMRAECLIHSSGYLILVSDTLELIFLDIEHALEYIRDVLTGKVSKQNRYNNNKAFGKWESTVL